jgi:hypothetical protein
VNKGGNGGATAGANGGAGTAWAKAFSGTSDRYLVSLAAVPGGGAVALGFFDGTLDLGGGPLASQGSLAGSEPAWTIFVARFADDGAHVWSKRFGGPGIAKPQAVAVDAAGNVYLTGGFANTLSFGETTLAATGGTDAFVAALDPQGVPRWAQRYGDAADQVANAIAVDPRGDVWLTGALWGSADFGGGALTSKGDDDVFVAKLSSTGAHRFSQRFGEAGSQRAFGLAVDGGGNALLTGAFEGGLDFGGGALPNAGGRDVFVAKLDLLGKHRFSASFGAAADQLGRAISASPDGRFAIAGELSGGIDFGPPRGDYAAKEPALPPLASGGAGGASGVAGAAGAAGGAGNATGGAGGQKGGSSGAAGAGGQPNAVDPLAGDCVGAGAYFEPTSGHCYRYSAEPKAWDDARAACLARGKGWSLLAVASGEELALVKGKFGFESAWCGASDAAKEGVFTWDNGEPFTLPGGKPPWNDGEPNDGGGAEDCVEIVGAGRLNDGDCKAAKPFVCERGSLWPLVGKGGTDAFVAVFDPTGKKLWDRAFGDGEAQSAWSVAFAANGGVVIGGDAAGGLDLGTGELPAGHAFVGAFDERGTPGWNARYGQGIGQVLALTVAKGRLFAGGAFSAELVVSGFPLSAGDHVGAFLLGQSL